ncbi:hypothetical protein A33M_1428 [Rhodovulum sp. PH10]|uniref:hypothetical protein n=1 Tax=Rhodovulum sp. PH10 TaxID=1187851 RepID=UPI00027C2AE6|nr:hypothetical protein [Rhodovulum sp. PH10]EJW12866.1 hypothetical protein A33M_1428 [Rhodovulum sp. PH10]
MRLMTFAACAAAAGLAAALLAAPAEAAPRRTAASHDTVIIKEEGRAPTRITVRRRSFLDPGPHQIPGTYHYQDYALSPAFTVYPSFFDYSTAPGSYSRMPLPGAFDVPGYQRY